MTPTRPAPAPAPARRRKAPERRATADEVRRLFAAPADERIPLSSGGELRRVADVWLLCAAVAARKEGAECLNNRL